MKLMDLCTYAEIVCPAELANDEVRAIVTDSRRAVSDSLFVCIRGLRQDGHRYVEDAVVRGAGWILAEEGETIESRVSAKILYTKNTRRALAYLMDAWYGYPSKRMTFVGVTGTNGKTSVTCMIRSIFERCGRAAGLIGTLGTLANEYMEEIGFADPLANMTTPEPEVLFPLLARMYASGVETVVMEVSSHALALGRVAPLSFAVSVFTNLTPEHLDFHLDMEDYANTKATLFAQSHHAILNADSPYAERMLHAAAGSCVAVSQTLSTADCRIENVSFDERGCSYTLRWGREEQRVLCPVAGAFSVMNSAQAILACVHLGISLSNACTALKHFEGVRGRMERVDLPPDAHFSALIDYAHTPDALKNLLQSVRLSNPFGRIVLLFGCGGDRDRQKRPLMGAIATSLADAVIVTADNSRTELTDSILREILNGIDFSVPCTVISNRALAIEYAVRTAQKGDVLLLAGKGHEEYEIGESGKRPFSEREILRSAYQNKIESKERDGLP